MLVKPAAPFGALLVVLLLFAPSASAEQFQLTAAVLGADSPNTGDGTLVGYFLEQRDGGALPAAGFHLEASTLRIETATTVKVYTDATDLSPPPEEASRRHTNAIVEGVAIREGFTFDVAPNGRALPTITFSSSCSQYASSNEETVSRTPWVAFRDATIFPTAKAVSWQGCGKTDIVIQGDFVLYLWKVDARITSNLGEEHLRTGREMLLDASPASSVSRDTDAYLFVQDGTLTFQENGATEHAAYLQNVEAASEMGFLLRQATGTLDLPGADVELAGQTATFHGDLKASLEATGANQSLLVGVSGGVDAVEVAGGQVFVAPRSTWHPLWTWGLLLGGVVALAAAVAWAQAPLRHYDKVCRSGIVFHGPARTRRQKRGLGYADWTHEAVRGKRFLRSRFYAQMALRLYPESVDAQYAVAVSKHGRGRQREAIPIYAKLRGRLASREARAENLGLMAMAYADVGLVKEAVAALKAVAAEHLPTFEGLIANHAFDGLAADSWFRRLRDSRLRYGVGSDPAIA